MIEGRRRTDISARRRPFLAAIFQNVKLSAFNYWRKYF